MADKINSIKPERLDGESFEDYKLRRKINNISIKYWLRGRMFWDSSKKGTYWKEHTS